ncbi:hypothetical protein HYZ41_01130 [archaeon]|nr:hypothetical protein [archaeon]
MDKKKRTAEIKKLISREYKIFLEEERLTSLPITVYEKACNFSEKIIRVKPDKKSGKRLQDAIDFTHLKATPTGIVSFTFLFLIMVLIPTFLLVFLGFFGYGMLLLLIGMILTYYIYYYPIKLKTTYTMMVGSDIVTFILYSVIYMRNNPSLEGAVKFAAENITGSIGYELKKMLWDVEVGNYLSMEEALTDYTKKWSANRHFVESVQLMTSSMKQVGEKRLNMLEEAVNIILEGNREDAKHFNQSLRLPVTVVHALGIILPVMGLVLFPIIAVFLHVNAVVLFIGYDIILPFMLYFIIMNILSVRPATFSNVDISENPNVPPKGRFRFKKKFVRAWPIAAIIGILIILFGLFLYSNESIDSKNFEGITPAIVITFGLALGFALYFILTSSQKMKLRSETMQIEGEFAEALFQLGNQVSSGRPIEMAMENTLARIKTLKIKELFSKAINNMKLLGFTFQQAFFEEKYGAVRYYPSKLIKSVMRTVVESSKKGIVVASNSMLSISKYLKNLHTTQEEVRDSLNEVVGSLKFQGFFLTPMISGTVATLAIIIIRILKQLGDQAPALGTSIPMISEFSQIPISPFQFIFVVAIYMIESSFIISMFINTIENGEDPIGRANVTGYTLIIGFVVFTVSLLMTLTMFGPLISSVTSA